MPWTPMKTRSRWTLRSAATANGPTSASRRRAHAAGQDDRLVAPAGLVEHVRDRDRVRDDGQARDVDEPLGERVGRRPGRDRRWPCPARRGPTAASAIASFSGCWRRDLAANPGSNRALPGERRRAAVDLLEQAPLVEDLEVAADGHVRHAELAHEVGDPHGPVLADAFEDQRLALSGEHVRHPPPGPPGSARHATAPSRASRCRAVEIAAQPPESQRFRTRFPPNTPFVLDTRARAPTIRVVLSDFVGQHRP